MRWEEIRDQWREVTGRMKSAWGQGKGKSLRDRFHALYLQLTTRDEQRINGREVPTSLSTATGDPSNPITIETRT